MRYFAGQMIVREQPMLYAVDLEGCQIRAWAPDTVTAAFVDALQKAGATVVQTLSHSFAGAGLTSVLILAESHAVLHTWPETGTVNIDIFSCSTRLQSLAAIEQLRVAFGAAGVSIQEIGRADGHASPGHERD